MNIGLVVNLIKPDSVKLSGSTRSVYHVHWSVDVLLEKSVYCAAMPQNFLEINLEDYVLVLGEAIDSLRLGERLKLTMPHHVDFKDNKLSVEYVRLCHICRDYNPLES